MADTLVHKEKKRKDAEKRTRAEARRKAELARTKDPKLAKKEAPKKIRRGIFPAEPNKLAVVSVKPGSVRGVVSGEAGKKRVEKAMEDEKKRKRRR